GIYAQGSAPIVSIDRNTIVKNLYGVRRTAGTFTVKNSIIAAKVGGTVLSGSIGLQGSMSCTYNDVYANDTDYSGCTAGTGSISRDARFISAAGNDYHLDYNSPCIDSGDPASVPDPDTSRADMGAFPFDLTVPGTLAVYVIEPNGGESWIGLTTEAITWYATPEIGQSVDHIELAYSLDGGSSYTMITSNETNDGAYDWLVANVTTTEAMIRVAAFGSAATDESDNVFSIAATAEAPPLVTVEAPNGGEKWRGGAAYNITFTVTDESGIKANSLYIWYSTNGGATFTGVITEDAAVSSPYIWQVPGGINSQQMRVRVTVSDIYDQPGTDESNADFTVDSTPPTVTVGSPDGGEKWGGSTSHNITWTAGDNFGLKADPITLRYSSNEGVSYTNILSNEANDGVFPWTVPLLSTNEARVKVLAEDECGNIGSDESNANFIIDSTPPTLPVLVTPPDGSITGDNTPLLTWEAATDPLTNVVSYEVRLDGSVVATLGAVTQYTAEALAEMIHTWEVRAKDEAGNWSGFSVSFTFEVDTIGPNFTAVRLSDRSTGNTEYTNNDTISLEALNVTGSPIEMMIEEVGVPAFLNWFPYANPTTVTFSDTTNGTKEIREQLRDAAHNESSWISGFIILDTQAPSTPTLVAPSNGAIVLQARPVFSWEAATDLTSGIANYEISIDGTIATTLAAVTSYTPATDLAGGSHTWKVRARDRADNWGSYSTTWSFTVSQAPFEVISLTFSEMGSDGVGLSSDIIMNFSNTAETDTVASAFSISPEVTGSLVWSADDRVMSFDPAVSYEVATSYAVDIATGARDINGTHLSSPFSYIFTTQSKPTDRVSPEVRAEVAGLALKSGDAIDDQPEIEIIATDNLSLDAASLRVCLDGSEVSYTIVFSTDISLEASYQPALALSSGSHTLEVEIRDFAGNRRLRTYADLSVAGAETGVNLTSPPIASKSVFAPASDKEGLLVAYSLNKDADVTFMTYGVAGEVVWTRHFGAGLNGGKAGYNEIKFSGVSDITGSPLANGIYVYRLISEGKAIGKGYIVIYE
ncbi:MAG: Ig-like domain-containing protein, partial [Candidatus Saganbacteria bacterium]|nr:Ig-like domain-containing protein [Candidatus Saganbacteria bacterium]